MLSFPCHLKLNMEFMASSRASPPRGASCSDGWAIKQAIGALLNPWIRPPCIKIFVAETTEELLTKIPRRLDGHPVVLEEAGEFRAL